MKAATKAAVLCAAIAAAFSAQAELKDFTVNGETVTKAQQEEQAKDVMAARRTDKMTPEIEAAASNPHYGGGAGGKKGGT